jgi:hypothetical protein
VDAAENVGRPLGDDDFLANIERLTGRPLKPSKRGRSRPDRKAVDQRYHRTMSECTVTEFVIPDITVRFF